MTIGLLTQTVSVQGQVYRVSNCLIDHALNEIPSIGFDVSLDFNPGRSAPVVGQHVVVTQVCNGTQVYRGEVSQVTRIRLNGGGVLFRVRALGESRKAARFRKIGVIPASSLVDGVGAVWDGSGVDLSQLPDPSETPTVPEFGMSYHSALEYMEFAERQTGWAWSLTENTLRVWDPRQITGNPFAALNMESVDIEAGSLEYSEHLDVVNVARQQAWYRRQVNAEALLVFDARCISSISLPRGAPSLDNGWEIESAEATRGSPLQGDLENVEVRVGPDMIELDPPMNWNPPPRVRITYRRLVWVEQEDHDSITLYGRREGPPLYHDGSMGVTAAHQNLKQYLQGASLPLVRLTAICLRSDVYPGQVVTLDVPEIGNARTFVIRRVRRATIGTELEIRFDAETIGIDPSSVAGAPRLRVRTRSSTEETIRRVENLERGPLNPMTQAGRVASAIGPVPKPVKLQSPIEWSCEITAAEPQDQGHQIETGVQWYTVAIAQSTEPGDSGVEVETGIQWYSVFMTSSLPPNE